MAQLLRSIRAAIRESSETPGAIAARAGVARSQVSRLLTGGAGISVRNVERLAQAMGMRVELRQDKRRRKKTRRATR
jgi:transcriptional regulator with XRE-family HTH domain